MKCIRLGAQWVHNVQVTSGNRTNPHPHLSSDRLIQPGDVSSLWISSALYNGYHTCVYRCFHLWCRLLHKQKEVRTRAALKFS